MQRDEACLIDIAQAIQEALDYVRGMTMDQFAADRKTQAAVMQALTVVGEAARRASPAFPSRRRNRSFTTSKRRFSTTRAFRSGRTFSASGHEL
jgi:uncharacterized protein with HEPN domain